MYTENLNPANRFAIAAAQKEMQGFKNSSGFRNAAGETSWSQDMGSVAYHNAQAQPAPVSLPNILNIQQSAAGLQTVNIGGAFANFAASNYGNSVDVTITYTSNNPLVPFTYGQFLGTTIGAPLQVGLMRIQAVTQAQATQTLSVLRNVGVGKFDGQSLFPLVYPNQYIPTITYVENAFKLDGFTTLSYSQNGTTDQFIQIYLYGNATVNLDRAFSNERVVQDYARPQTGISNNLTIQAQPLPAGTMTRKTGLL